jgi:hypothetical protein
MALKVVEALGADRVPSFPEEDFGARAKSLRSWIGQHLVSDTLTFEEAYFEMLPFVFSCGLNGLATAAATATVGANNMYQWAYVPLMKGLQAPKSFTLEKADDVVNYECDYGMFERINIKGTINQGSEVSACTVTGDFFAREWTSAAATALSPIEVFAINAKLGTLDIDALWANLGTTPMTKSLRAFDIDILTGLHPKMLGSAQKDFDVHAEGIIHVTSAFTFEGNALASTEYGHFLTQTDRAYRLTLTNPATLASHGANSRLMIDVFGRWKEVIPFADEDRGNNLFTLVHESMLDPLDYAVSPDMLNVTVNTTIGAV